MKNYEIYCKENNFTISEYTLYLLLVILPTFNKINEFLDIPRNYLSKSKMLEIVEKNKLIYRKEISKNRDDRYSTIRLNCETKEVIENYLKEHEKNYFGYKLTQTLTLLHKFNIDNIMSKKYLSSFTNNIADDKY